MPPSGHGLDQLKVVFRAVFHQSLLFTLACTDALFEYTPSFEIAVLAGVKPNQHGHDF